MARSSGTGSGRGARTTSKRPDRAAWEKALAAATELPTQERQVVDNLTSEFLPRFVETLRSKGYVQKSIIAEVKGLGFGISASQVRAADKTLRSQQSPPPPVESGAAPAPAAPRIAPPFTKKP
jgi:hypothetical protein